MTTTSTATRGAPRRTKTPIRAFRVAAVPLLYAGLLVAAGCSGPSSAPTTPAVAGGGTAPPSAAAATAGSPGNICSAIPAAAASAATGLSFTSATEGDNSANGSYACYYNGADSLHWTVAVYQSPSRVTFDEVLIDLGGAGNAQPVSGIGDKAYVSPVGVGAQFGNRYLVVGSPNNSASNETGYQTLAKAAITALK